MYSRSQIKTHQNQGLMNELANQFLAAKAKKTVFSNFRIEGSKLVYQSRETNEVKGYFGNNKERSERIAELETIVSKIESGEFELHSDYELSKVKEGIETLRKDKDINYGPSFKYSETCVDTIAVKLPSGLIIGNSSVLPNVGKTVAYGNVDHNNRETLIQRILSEKISMIPFNVFEEAELDIASMKIVDQSGAETIRVKETYREGSGRWSETKERTVNRHFTGATVFECDGKQFLFDADRNELQHSIFNAFLVQLPRKVKTVAEAYESLKPSEVKAALAKGLDVKRQGEWFFIPCAAPQLPKPSKEDALFALLRDSGTVNAKGKVEVDRWNNRSNLRKNLVNLIGKDRIRFYAKRADAILARIPRTALLKTGDNRPNEVESVVTIKGITFVKGVVKHTGREHKDLKLNTWHRAIPNTATKSFTILGDVD